MVSIAANVRLSPGGVLFLVLIGIVCILYAKNKFPSITSAGPTDLLNAVKMGEHSTLTILKEKSNISMKRLIAASLHVAEMGGQALNDVRKKASFKVGSKGKTQEGANDPVTEGDLASHRIMFGGLKATWPSLHIISEEKDNTATQNVFNRVNKVDFHYLDSVLKSYEDSLVPLKDVTVWIDPLDATQEYTENLMKYVTTMVCIAVKGVPVAGIIHQPSLGLSHWAWVGHGHSEIKQTPYEGKTVRIIVSRSHAGSVNETAKKAFADGYEVIPAGGAGYKVLNVASGLADVYAHVTAIKKWDICAGNALIKSIGGNMSDMAGKEIDYSPSSKVKLRSGLLVSLKDHKRFLSHFKETGQKKP